MKKVIFAFLLVVSASGLTYLYTSWAITERAEGEARFAQGLRDLRIEFLTHNVILRPITDLQQRPDLQKYLAEVNLLANWYFQNPAKDFWSQHPDRNDPESIIAEYRRLAAQEGPRQKSAKGNLPIREECYKLAGEVYDALKAGTYKAIASDFQGSVRFDVFRVVREGNRLNWQFVAWGGIGELVYDGWHMRWFKTPSTEDVTAYDKELARAKRRGREPAMPDPRTQHLYEAASQTKSPRLPPFDGSEYIVDFPAGTAINYFTTSTCPPDSEEVEIKFKLKARAVSGEAQRMEFVFRLPVDSGWKGSWEGVRTIEAAQTY